MVLWRSEASRLSLIRLYLGDFHSLKAVRVMKAAEVKKSATWRDSATLVRQKGLCPPFLRPLILTECSLTVHGAYIYRDASLTPTVASPIYTPYEGPNLANQINRKLGVLDRKSDGSHCMFCYFEMNQ